MSDGVFISISQRRVLKGWDVVWLINSSSSYELNLRICSHQLGQQGHSMSTLRDIAEEHIKLPFCTQ